MATKHGDQDRIPHESRHEVSDVSARPIFYFAMGLVVLIVLTLLSMKILFNLLDQDANRSDPKLSGVASERPQLAPLPRLETDPISARKEFFQKQKMLIESYGWVDQKQGIVRVPITRAMELLVERGLPVSGEARSNPRSEQSRKPVKLESEKRPTGK